MFTSIARGPGVLGVNVIQLYISIARRYRTAYSSIDRIPAMVYFTVHMLLSYIKLAECACQPRQFATFGVPLRKRRSSQP
jgi:hypothetical protein